MSEPEEPYVEYSDSMEYHLPEPWERSPRDTSGKPTGNDYQRLLSEAVSGCEFTPSVIHGMPAKRQGSALHISYDNAIELLWGTDDYQRL